MSEPVEAAVATEGRIDGLGKVAPDSAIARLMLAFLGTAGLFYAWSPHMPLSVDGLKEIIAAGDELDVLVLPVLSPHANVDYALDRLRDRGLPADLLRQSESAELVKRDLFLHAPAIIIFNEGEFVSPVLPGLRRAGDYAKLIGRFLKNAEEQPL